WRRPLRRIREDRVGRDLLDHRGGFRRKTRVIPEPLRDLSEDGRVKDTGGEISPGFSWMAAVWLPERPARSAGDERSPGVTDRRSGHPLIGGDRQVSVVDRRLHARVGGHACLWPAVAPSPGEIEERPGALVADRADEPASRRVHLRLAELFDRRNLALLLQHDDVPAAGGERGRGGLW